MKNGYIKKKKLVMAISVMVTLLFLTTAVNPAYAKTEKIIKTKPAGCVSKCAKNTLITIYELITSNEKFIKLKERLMKNAGLLSTLLLVNINKLIAVINYVAWFKVVLVCSGWAWDRCRECCASGSCSNGICPNVNEAVSML